MESFKPESKEGQKVSVIVKTTKANYVPTGVKLRTRIDDFLFTADTSSQHIDKLHDNPGVESVSVNKRLPSLD